MKNLFNFFDKKYQKLQKKKCKCCNQKYLKKNITFNLVIYTDLCMNCNKICLQMFEEWKLNNRWWFGEDSLPGYCMYNFKLDLYAKISNQSDNVNLEYNEIIYFEKNLKN